MARYSRFESPRRVIQWRSGGMGNPVCEKCHHHLAVYTPACVAALPEVRYDQFQRRPFGELCVHYRERTVAVRHVKRAVGLPAYGSLRRRSICRGLCF
ncbi:hypothetical protein KCP74_23270 [Salmonella enterica subsp. enterica]|nr:hypothetical protein KCP74_23270 [Salmonella enterica subsp. enterica]